MAEITSWEPQGQVGPDGRGHYVVVVAPDGFRSGAGTVGDAQGKVVVWSSDDGQSVRVDIDGTPPFTVSQDGPVGGRRPGAR